MKTIVILLGLVALAYCAGPPKTIEGENKPGDAQASQRSSFVGPKYKICPKYTAPRRKCPRPPFYSFACKQQQCLISYTKGYSCLGLVFSMYRTYYFTGIACGQEGAHCSKPYGCRCQTVYKWFLKLVYIKHCEDGKYYKIKLWFKIPYGCDCTLFRQIY